MHWPEILKKKGCGPERLREIFTKGVGVDTPADLAPGLDTLEADEFPKTARTDEEIHRRFRTKIRSRTLEGITANLRASRPNQAVDLAADAPPIQKHMIPLMMWAQGRLNIERAYRACATESQEQADRLFNRQKVGDNEVIKLNENRITDISIDLLKSYVTRRHAAMDSLWSNLWPLFRYDPRGADDVAQLRGDVLSQRVDIISDSYNYRHFFSQCRRQMLLYGYSVVFPRSAWDRKVGWRPKQTNTGEPSNEIESYVEREGVDFVNPHPSRIFYDLSAPLPNVNTDTGPSYIGYWDVVPWRTLIDVDNSFFNLENVFVTNGWTDLASTYGEFWAYYFDPCVMAWPEIGAGQDPSMGNDLKANVGRYTSIMTDVGVLLTHYFERINPLHEGIGKYDCDIWIHLTVAGDCTIVDAEFLPSIPACYGGVNINDGRLANQSMAMALLGYQDQASNIMSSMLMQLRTSLVQLWLIDQDSLGGENSEIMKGLMADAKGDAWYSQRHVLAYSATKLRELGIQDPKMAFGVVQAQIQNVFEAGLKALSQLLNLADRLLILSPNELGQPNPREVAAREVTEIAGSVQAINSFNNEGPREQVAAVKELIYDSLITHGQQDFRVPVERRYTKEIIKAAGFEIPEDVEKRIKGNTVPVKTPVMGNLRDLVYDYYFNSRDGAERVLNTQGAQVMTQLFQFILQSPLAEKFGTGQLEGMLNTIIRMSGAPTNLQLEVPMGQGDELPNQEQLTKQVAELQQQLQQLGQFVTQNLRGTAPAPANGQPPLPPPGGGAPSSLQDIPQS